MFEKQFNNVKISNIFTDTSGDDSHLHAQFTLMSTSHYTNNYILVLDECDLLKQLNITHSIRLPPNKAVQVEMNFTLQIYTERKQRTCYGGLIFIISIASIIFLISFMMYFTCTQMYTVNNNSEFLLFEIRLKLFEI